MEILSSEISLFLIGYSLFIIPYQLTECLKTKFPCFGKEGFRRGGGGAIRLPIKTARLMKIRKDRLGMHERDVRVSGREESELEPEPEFERILVVSIEYCQHDLP